MPTDDDDSSQVKFLLRSTITECGMYSSSVHMILTLLK